MDLKRPRIATSSHVVEQGPCGQHQVHHNRHRAPALRKFVFCTDVVQRPSILNSENPCPSVRPSILPLALRMAYPKAYHAPMDIGGAGDIGSATDIGREEVRGVDGVVGFKNFFFGLPKGPFLHPHPQIVIPTHGLSTPYLYPLPHPHSKDGRTDGRTG